MSNDYGSDFITLTDDEGVEYELEHLDTLELDNQVYMAFTPADASPDAEELDIVILRVDEDGDTEELLVTVEDEEELERVYAAFMERLESEDADED